jgi:hypothetical protein
MKMIQRRKEEKREKINFQHSAIVHMDVWYQVKTAYAMI